MTGLHIPHAAGIDSRLNSTTFMDMKAYLFATLFGALPLLAADSSKPAPAPEKPVNQNPAIKTETALLAGGCFWCVEAVYEEVPGVIDASSGYIGGHVKNPNYKQVTTGTTGHAEVTRVEFDPAKVSFSDLLEIFWHVHDPTTLNRQGNDIGTQYRSGIFYLNETQKAAAEKSKTEAQKEFDSPIVTEITAATEWYPAEDYHQDYFRLNPGNRYCQAVIPPKLKKLEKLKAEKKAASEPK
jgi:peptide-methionine (S)-S-oxide reductase